MMTISGGGDGAGSRKFRARRIRRHPAQATAGPPAGGSSTAGVFAPVKDARKRPITAGGFVDGAPIVFEDRTAGSGLEKFRHRSGSPEKTSILDVPSGGVALIDFDNDGWLDIYLVNDRHAPLFQAPSRRRAPRSFATITISRSRT